MEYQALTKENKDILRRGDEVEGSKGSWGKGSWGKVGEEGCGDRVYANGWFRRPLKNKVVKKTTTNSAIPKFPDIKEVLSQLDFAENDPLADRVVEGVKVAYEFIARQLSA